MPIKNPLKTKNMSTPIVPKNWINLSPVASEFGNNKIVECEQSISKIATALTTSKPKTRFLYVVIAFKI